MTRWTDTALIFVAAVALSWLGWMLIDRLLLRPIAQRSDFWRPLLARSSWR